MQGGELRPKRFEGLALVSLFIDSIFNHFIVHIVALFVVLATCIWAFAPYHTARWIAPVVAVVLYAALLLAWNTLVWLNLKLAYNAQSVLVSEGVFFKRERIVDLNHLQGLMFRTGPVLKVFRRCEVTAETAGGLNRAEVVMPALDLADAYAFERAVYRGAQEAGAGDKHAAWRRGFKLPLSYIFVSALTNNSVVWAALTIVVPLTTAVVKSLSKFDFNISHIVDQGIFVWAISLIGALIALAITIVSVSIKFLIDLARKVFAAYGFEVNRTGHLLHTRRGLIVTRESYMDVSRVQALHIERPFLQRLLGFGALNLDTAGFSNANRDGGSITSLAPIMRKRQMHELVSNVLPEFATTEVGERSDVRGLGRFTFGPSMTAVIALIIALFATPLWHVFVQWLNKLFGVRASYVLSWWTPWLAWIVALSALIFMVTEIDVWFATRAAVDGDMLVLRNGRLGRKEVRIHRANIQGMMVRQTVFQKNDGHAHLKCYLVSGSRGQCVTLRNLTTEVSAEIYDWYYAPK